MAERNDDANAHSQHSKHTRSWQGCPSTKLTTNSMTTHVGSKTVGSEDACLGLQGLQRRLEFLARARSSRVRLHSSS